MAYYNSSSAYEYDNSVIVTPEKQEKTSARLRVVSHKKARGNAVVIAPRSVLMFLFVVGIICLMLYNQAQINEINGKISRVKTEIQQMESEYVRMHSTLESTISLRNVALQAEQELGLQHATQYQIEYLSIYEEDQVEIIDTGEGDSISEQVETFVASIFQKVSGDDADAS